MMLHTGNVADQTDHLANVFVRENVATGYDVVTFESTQPTPFCLEKSEDFQFSGPQKLKKVIESPSIHPNNTKYR